MAIGAKYHSDSAYPPKFLVQFEAKYLPQIAPEAVSEHEYVKISWGGMPPDPPRGAWIFIRFLDLPLYMQPPPPKSKCLDPPLLYGRPRGCGFVANWIENHAGKALFAILLWMVGTQELIQRGNPKDLNYPQNLVRYPPPPPPPQTKLQKPMYSYNIIRERKLWKSVIGVLEHWTGALESCY